jgi:hypothetical protein
VRRDLGVPPWAVWELISTPGHLERCHPFCASNPVATWPGVGSRDEIHYYGGMVLEREFTAWDDGSGYELDIGEPGGPTSHVAWRIAGRGPEACRLAITITPREIGGLPGPLRALAGPLWVRPRLRRYLRSVLRGVDWVVTRREAVTRNQFGSHAWFSPAPRPHPAGRSDT